jgi:hypothetical protein
MDFLTFGVNVDEQILRRRDTNLLQEKRIHAFLKCPLGRKHHQPGGIPTSLFGPSVLV